jgi:hypothetical protein
MNESTETKINELRKKNKKIKNRMILIIIALLVLIGVALFLGKDYIFEKDTKDDKKKTENKEEPKEEKKLQIIDLDSKSRPIGVMIDNIRAAWPQAGLKDAYLVYEIIVEGGQTRLFALFKDTDTDLIGPIRSSRHYYLDYALENDAIYGHFGWSPQAQRDISLLHINNLNGMTNAGASYWRDNAIAAPHNVFTSIENLKSRATSLGYKLETDKPTLLNYSVDEIKLNKEINAQVASNIRITYSSYHYTSYVYDEITKVYKRSMLGIAHVDKETGVQYTAKNIIIAQVANHADPENSDKGRQALENKGKGSGYYITEGYTIPITWEKSSRASQTVYKKISGEEITVNDGNTYIQIQPLNQPLTME